MKQQYVSTCKSLAQFLWHIRDDRYDETKTRENALLIAQGFYTENEQNLHKLNKPASADNYVLTSVYN